MPYDFSGISAPPNQGLSQEELRKLIEQQKKQQAQSSSESQPKAQSKPQAMKPAKKPEQYGPPAPGQQGGAGSVQGIQKFFEENVAIPVVDFFDNTLQGDQKTPDQIARERQVQRTQSTRQGIETQRQFEAAQGPAGKIFGEGVRAVLGSGEDLAEGLINLPFQAVDLVSPYSHTPIRSNIIRENETAVGDGLRTLSRYVLSSRLGSGLTGGALTTGQSGAALFGGRFVQGFVEDFLGADGTGDDGTLIGSTPFTRMLQTADENQAVHNRALVGIEGGLFEAAGIPAVRAFVQVTGLGKAARRLKDVGSSYLQGRNQKKLNDLIAKVSKELNTQLNPVSPATTEDEIAALLEQTKQMLSDPKVLQDQRKVKAVAAYNKALREAAAPRLAREANQRLKTLLAQEFAGDNYGKTLDYTQVTERDLALRLIQEDPQRLKLNRLIAEAAGTADSSDLVFDYLRQKVEAYPAAKQLDDLAETIQYGGPPDELVIDGTRLPEYTDQLRALDAEATPATQTLDELRQSVSDNVKVTNDLSTAGGRLNLQIAQLQAEIPSLPTLADTQKASQVKLSLSAAQVKRVQQLNLPEGITITPGRRVQGLTPDNIDEFRAAVAELAASGDSVAQNLSKRLDNLDLPEALPQGTRTQEAAAEELALLQEERNAIFQDAVSKRLERKDIGLQIRELQARLDEVKVQREAQLSRLTGKQEQFAANYQPVDMTTKNVTSIVKERAGGQPGLDLYFEDKRFPALLDGRVKEIGRQGGADSGYGNYVVVESIDPKTGKSVDVLYAHLEDGSINVKEGDLVGTGQQIGKQGGTGRVRSVDGTIASVDFLAPAPKGSKSMTPYARWSELADEITASIRKGEVQPSQVGRKAPAVAQETIDAAAAQADEAVAPKTRKQAIEEGFEIDEVVPARPRTDLLDTFTTEPHQTVVGTAQPGKAGLTDIDIYSLNNGTPEGMQLLLDQVQNIDRAMMYGELETVLKIEGAQKLADEFLDLPIDELNKLVQDPNVSSVVEGHPLLTAKGYAATGLVLREIQDQLIDLGYNTIRHDALGSPEAQKEAVRLLDRMQVMLRLRTIHKQVASGKLRELQYIGENLGRGSDVGFGAQGADKKKLVDEMIANYKDQLAKDEAIYRTFDALKAEIRKGNPAAFAHLKRVAQGMTLISPTQSNFRVMQSILAAMGKNVDALYVNSILSGPVTQMRNIWGNFYQTTGHPLLAYLAAQRPGKKYAKVRMQAAAAIGANIESYMEFGSLLAKATKEQWSVLGKSSLEAAESGIKEYSMWDEALEANMKRIERMKDAGELHWHQEMMYTLAIWGRKMMESPFFRPMMAIMGGADNTFKVIAARQVAARRAVEDALQQMGDAPLTGKRTQQFADLVAKNKEFQLSQIFDEAGQIIDQEAKELGEVFTFQTPIGEADQFTKNLNALSSVPLMKTLGLTFVKTPSAILKSAANLTPGVSSVLKRMDIKYRNGSDYYRAMRDGAEAMSYILGASTFYLGATGVITGAGPLSGRERDLWLQSHKPFTIKIGEMEINYQGWEPAASVMGLFADLGALGFGDRQGDLNLVSAIAALSSNVVNKSYLAQISTMAQVIGAVTENDYKRLGENIARGLVPYSGLRNQAGQLIDTAYREVRSQIEPSWSWFLKKQTGLGSTASLPQRLDEVTGKPLTRDGVDGIGGSIVSILNLGAFGSRLSKNRFEPVHKFLDEVGLDITNGLNTVGSLDLTNDEMVEYIKLRAADGEMKKSLLTYFNSDRYQKVDKPQMEYDLSIGKEYNETQAYKNASAIVKGFHQRAIAQMRLGLTDVSQGFAARYKEAQKAALMSENMLNKRADVLRPQADQPLNTTLLY